MGGSGADQYFKEFANASIDSSLERIRRLNDEFITTTLSPPIRTSVREDLLYLLEPLEGWGKDGGEGVVSSKESFLQCWMDYGQR